MHERRNQRSGSVISAIHHFLEALCVKRGLEGAALTTTDGLLVAGVGHLDVEWMGALGASTSRRMIEWEARELHINRFRVNNVELCLTTAGAPVPDATPFGSIRRILGLPA